MKVRVGSLAPHVTIGNHFEGRLIFFNSFIAISDCQIHRKVRIHIEWRVNIDQVDFSRVIDAHGRMDRWNPISKGRSYDRERRRTFRLKVTSTDKHTCAKYIKSGDTWVHVWNVRHDANNRR